MQIPSTYTVESVTNGHPDKICDQISDAILDECLKQDPMSRVAIECMGAHGQLFIGGEVTTKAEFAAEKIAKKVYAHIGYVDDLEIITNIIRQSSDIAQGVDTGGAGDQGIMYGYATNENEDFLPEAVVLVHKLTMELENLRKKGILTWLKPDGKAQVTVNNDELIAVLVSTQHQASVAHGEINESITDKLIRPLTESSKLKQSPQLDILVNPTGKFVVGGFVADSGLTGRKIMVDTYGGLIPHGGGCFSGKDPTKVDRSAAYMCRFVAKNVVANGLADKCLVSVAYAIGKADPLMVSAKDGEDKDISDLVQKHFDFRPNAIIERLDLRRPIYLPTAAYGHFGKPNLPWEKIVKL